MARPDQQPAPRTGAGAGPAPAPALHAAVAAWLVDGQPGGASRRLLSLVRAAAPRLRNGERITVLCGRDSPPLSGGPGVDVLRIPVPARPAWRRVLAERRELPRVLADLGATVLDLGSLPVPPRLPCPVVLTVHDLRDLGQFRRRPRALALAILRRGVARAHQVIVPSAFTAAELRAAVPTSGTRVTVIPGAVDDAFYRRTLVAPERPFFLHVGHLEPRKNLPLLLRAYARFVAECADTESADAMGADAERREGSGARRAALASALDGRDVVDPSRAHCQVLRAPTRPDLVTTALAPPSDERGGACDTPADAACRRRSPRREGSVERASRGALPDLVLAGTDCGHGRRLRRLAAALGVAERVHFAAGLGDDGLLDLYGGAVAVLVPSLYEGFGLPVLEALAMGSPVVVSDRGALPEVIGDAGRVVAGDDPGAWTNALLAAWRTPARTADDEQRRRRRARTFRWQEGAARLLQVWRAASAVGDRTASPAGDGEATSSGQIPSS